MNNAELYNDLINMVDKSLFISYIFMCDLTNGSAKLSTTLSKYLGLSDTTVVDFKKCIIDLLDSNNINCFDQAWNDILESKCNSLYIKCRLRSCEKEYDNCVLKGKIVNDNLFVGTVVVDYAKGTFDAVTDLFGYEAYSNRISKAIKNNEKFISLAVDLSSFHSINTVHGYSFANKALFMLAKTIKQVVGRKGRVFKLEGTRFVIFFRNAEMSYIRGLFIILRDLVKFFEVDGQTLSLKLYGVAVSSDIKVADSWSYVSYLISSLEHSKNEKIETLSVFDENTQNDSHQTLELLEVIKNSIFDDCRGFYLCYQPFVSAVNGNVIGAEALIRWRNETYGDVSPYRFIDQLESHPSFYELGLWVVRQALTDTKEILKVNPTFFINVNISYMQLEHPEFKHDLLNILNEFQYPASQIQLELTERCRNLDINFLKNELNYFRKYGIKIALDDFGTGSASLGLVSELPIDCLKIDQLFIRNILKNNSSQVIVGTVLECASRLGINVCLEGVEDDEVREFVSRYAANYHQGYYYSKPIVYEEFKKLIFEKWDCNRPRLYINESRDGLNEHNILANVPGGFFVYTADEEEKIIQINQTAIEMYGCKDLAEFVELTNNSFKGMVHPDDYERITNEINNQINSSSTNMDYVEYRIVKKDGSVMEVLDYGHLVESDYNGDLFYVFIIPKLK